MAEQQMFVPPSTIRFRLIGSLSRKALISNPRNDHRLYQWPMAEVFDDQWFYVFQGTGDKASLYRLKSAFTNEAVYLNWDKPGTTDFNGTVYDDQWLKFEPGTGTHTGTFRILCPLTGKAICSRADESKADIYSSATAYDDQWFSFAYEDMQLEDISYDLKKQKFLEVKPVAISTKTATNRSDETQTSTITFSESVEEERSFQSELGTTLGISSTASVGIPLVAEGKVTVSAEISTTISWGKTDRVTKTWSDAVAVTTGPKKVIKVYASARQSRFTVPFTAVWKSKSTGETMSTKGNYEGVSVYDFDTTYSEAMPLPPAPTPTPPAPIPDPLTEN
ncbi:hypothetical protein TWF694_002578 [Orbilia ellipsospora]|uniref:Uncharacterized protein n=1 Tax=Orbilia ellipsospora TaxID=2528407 RepID=A0AAV9X2Q3_9PEZI